jgi:hypothetical protein
MVTSLSVLPILLGATRNQADRSSRTGKDYQVYLVLIAIVYCIQCLAFGLVWLDIDSTGQ